MAPADTEGCADLFLQLQTQGVERRLVGRAPRPTNEVEASPLHSGWSPNNKSSNTVCGSTSDTDMTFCLTGFAFHSPTTASMVERKRWFMSSASSSRFALAGGVVLDPVFQVIAVQEKGVDVILVVVRVHRARTTLNDSLKSLQVALDAFKLLGMGCFMADSLTACAVIKVL